MKRKIVSMALMVLGLSMYGVSVQGSEMRIRIGDKFIESEVAPVQKNGMTMVPLRVVAENLNAVVEYDNKVGKITIKKNQNHITLYIGRVEGEANGVKVRLQAAPETYNGVTMVPLRFIAENLNCEVEYNAQSLEIQIKEVNEVSDKLTEEELNENGIHTLTDGSLFLGDAKNGVAYGYGVRTDKNGKNILGEFDNGVPNGYCMLDNTDYVYIGQVKNGVPEGYGYIMYMEDREETIGDRTVTMFSYIGQIKDGKPHGYGVVGIYDNFGADVAYLPVTYKEGKKILDNAIREAIGVNGEKYSVEDLFSMSRGTEMTIGKNGVLNIDKPIEDQIVFNEKDVYYKGVGLFDGVNSLNTYTKGLPFFVGEMSAKVGDPRKLGDRKMTKGVWITSELEIIMGDWKEDGTLDKGCGIIGGDVYIGDMDKDGKVTNGVFLSLSNGSKYGIIRE